MTGGRTGTTAWIGLAAVAGLAGAAGHPGGASLMLLLLCGGAMLCAVHRPSRAFVTDKASRFFSGGAIRPWLIILGGAMLIQFLPLEMALFAAGDVLAYVELLAAIGLVAANTRLKPMVTRARQRFVDAWRARPTPLRAARQRTGRPHRRPPSLGDDGEGRPAWAYA